MSKRKILHQNDGKIEHKKTNKDLVFDYFRERKNTKIRISEIVKKLNIPSSTVRRIVEELIKEKTCSGNTTYEIVKEGVNYKMIKKTAAGNVIVSLSEMLNAAVDILAKPFIWKDTQAKPITKTVVLYEINLRYRKLVIEALTEMCGDGIYDIVPCDKGLYIILKENKKTPDIQQAVLDLYVKACREGKKTANKQPQAKQ